MLLTDEKLKATVTIGIPASPILLLATFREVRLVLSLRAVSIGFTPSSPIPPQDKSSICSDELPVNAFAMAEKTNEAKIANLLYYMYISTIILSRMADHKGRG